MSHDPLLRELSIDDVVNQIGSGKFHYKILILVYFNSLQQMSQCALPGIILPSLTNEFHLSKTEISIYGTFEYFGFFIASLAVGKISDLLGRRKGIVIFQIVWLISMLLSILSPNIYFFSLCRCILSISFMIVIFCGFSLLSEIWPQKTRGIVINLVTFVAVLAYATTSSVARLLIDNLETGNWRLLFLIYSAILAFSICVNTLMLEESLRYDLLIGQKERAFTTIDRMAKTNLRRDDFLQNGKREQIERWAENFSYKLNKILEAQKQENQFIMNYKKLFKGPYKKITTIMFILWSVISSTMYGMEFILPTVMLKISEGTDQNPLSLLFYLNIVILPCMLITIALVENERFGRRKTLSIVFLLMGISGVMTFFHFFPGLIFWLCLFKYTTHASIMLIYLYTAELYPTSLRVNAFGQCSAVSRIPVLIIVWVAVFLLDIGTFVPFFIYGLMGFLAFYVMGLLNQETLNEDIDRIISN